MAPLPRDVHTVDTASNEIVYTTSTIQTTSNVGPSCVSFLPHPYHRVTVFALRKLLGGPSNLVQPRYYALQPRASL